MNNRLRDSLNHIKRDALAGTVSGVMAVPLTIGICLMSDYPVMMGLYTVTFACVISFITYLIKPGNYTGVPGVAAGLAPALAMGIATFGYENMPFVIFLTSLFQAIVWKFKWERFILIIVPAFLVEGLLAGVGLKILVKFFPFLYDIQHTSEVWLNLEREVVIFLSLFSFFCFIYLYKRFEDSMPAIPYFFLLATSFILSFVLSLAMVAVESVPFQLSWPLPHLQFLTTQQSVILIIKMVLFALMLGTIDIIEQVMSNVAIEKIDPLQRKTDSNSSLLAIWIANMGATFFGGMTNLDGLAKSTTNTIAGARTKISNIFTAFVLLTVIFFPVILTHLPEYALGVIMVFSGWKMIASIFHIKSHGKYPFSLAILCALFVYKLGIFEGLIIVLVINKVTSRFFQPKSTDTDSVLPQTD